MKQKQKATAQATPDSPAQATPGNPAIGGVEPPASLAPDALEYASAYQQNGNGEAFPLRGGSSDLCKDDFRRLGPDAAALTKAIQSGINRGFLPDGSLRIQRHKGGALICLRVYARPDDVKRYRTALEKEKESPASLLFSEALKLWHTSAYAMALNAGLKREEIRTLSAAIHANGVQGGAKRSTHAGL